MKKPDYELIVVGAGHAGIEAANISSRLGVDTLLLTFDIDTIGKLSCNPAVGGIAKSHLVREIDILGGVIASFADRSALQYRILNKSKGKAVWATRVQVDRSLYNRIAREFVLKSEIKVLQAEVEAILVKKGRVWGVSTNLGEITSKRVVLCPGTFLDGLIHVGFNHWPQGRLGEPASQKLYENLKSLGFNFRHFKTGTCARLDKRTVDFSKMIEQPPDKEAYPLSFFTEKKNPSPMSCYITYTNPRTHKIIKKGLKFSPLYQGVIKSKGVRYCPSIEDKVVKFSSKDRHQIFIEPEGIDSQEVYPNGISTSLPLEIQYEFIHSIEGLEKTRIIRPGYGIEHGVIDSQELFPTLESKKIKGLFFAGQVNGTTGYEEAAAQGIIAGINSALSIRGKRAFILDRSESFIGLLIDDLVTKGTDEPYRMFTSRSEYRLLLREQNAVYRLFRKAYNLGLLGEEVYKKIKEKQERINKEIHSLRISKLKPSPKVVEFLRTKRCGSIKNVLSFYELLKRPAIKYKDLEKLGYSSGLFSRDEIDEVEIEVKYEGFIRRQEQALREFEKIDRIKIPADIDYSQINGLSKEIREKLSLYKPCTLAEAIRIPGVTPSAIMLLLNYINRCKGKNREVKRN